MLVGAWEAVARPTATMLAVCSAWSCSPERVESRLWEPVQTIEGRPVAIDGSSALVWQDGVVRSFTKTPMGWRLAGDVAMVGVGFDPNGGPGLDVELSGETALHDGVVWVRRPGGWEQQADLRDLVPADGEASVSESRWALSGDVAVSARVLWNGSPPEPHYRGDVHFFYREQNTWALEHTAELDDGVPAAVATTRTSTMVAVEPDWSEMSGPNDVLVFERQDGVWDEPRAIGVAASAICIDEGRAVLGGGGTLHFLDRDERREWTVRTSLTASCSLGRHSLRGDHVVCASPGGDWDPAESEVAFYEREGIEWVEASRGVGAGPYAVRLGLSVHVGQGEFLLQGGFAETLNGFRKPLRFVTHVFEFADEPGG